MNRTAELLSQLVACRSDQGEQAMVALLAKLLEPWGARITVQETAPGRPNLIATFAGRDPARSLMLEAHSDTVGGDAPFEPTVREHLLYGRGACDTKGSMAAMLLGIRAVLERDGQPPCTIHFVSTSNEELGATGAHALVASGFRTDAAVVGEPTELRIVYAHKGAVRLRIHTEGVAAHSAEPSRGVNAIYKMRRVVEALEERVAPALQQIHHPLLGSPVLSVGTIHGGTQVNVVPKSCTIEVDRRLIPGEQREAVIAQMLDGQDAVGEAVEYYPPFEESRESAVTRLLAAACENVLNRAEFTTAPWASNAGVFKAPGIPCVVFGPGSISQAHTRDEFIDLEQVEKAAGIFEVLVRRGLPTD